MKTFKFTFEIKWPLSRQNLHLQLSFLSGVFFWSCLTKIYGGAPQACRSEHIMMICHMQMLKRSRTGLFWQISIEITQVLRKFFLFLPFSYYLSFAYYYSCIFFLNKQKECHGFHPEIDSKIKFTYSEKATKTRKNIPTFLELTK